MKNKSELQYYLKIENGEISEEQGHFFRAIPFSIKAKNCEVHCTFEHKEHEVVYNLSEKNQNIAHLEHPDYLPEDNPQNSQQHIKSSVNPQFIIEALLQLKIAKSKDYVSYLK
eukprot:COSAG04_NODE_3132_length_3133_cov_1.515162_1_plen_112_part_10